MLSLPFEEVSVTPIVRERRLTKKDICAEIRFMEFSMARTACKMSVLELSRGEPETQHNKEDFLRVKYVVDRCQCKESCRCKECFLI